MAGNGRAALRLGRNNEEWIDGTAIDAEHA
jgi:hypothetical protein